MANNPYVNKVVYGDQILIDLTDDDVVASDVAQGKKFHTSDGVQRTGTATGGGGTPKYAIICNRNMIPTISAQDCLFIGGQVVTIRLNGTNVNLTSIKYGTTTASTVTIATTTSGYESGVWIRERHYLTYNSAIIVYSTQTGDSAWSADTARIISMKSDGSIVQSSTFALSGASSSTSNAFGHIMQGRDGDFIAVRWAQTVSNSRWALGAYRAYCTPSTPALAQNSTAILSVTANDYSQPPINDIKMAHKGGFFFTNVNNVDNIITLDSYSSGAKTVTKANATSESVTFSNKHYILGMTSDGLLVTCYTGSTSPYIYLWMQDDVSTSNTLTLIQSIAFTNTNDSTTKWTEHTLSNSALNSCVD